MWGRIEDIQDMGVDHEMTVAQLRALLDDLPPDARLVPNHLQNINVYNAAGDAIGTIDFAVHVQGYRAYDTDEA